MPRMQLSELDSSSDLALHRRTYGLLHQMNWSWGTKKRLLGWFGPEKQRVKKKDRVDVERASEQSVVAEREDFKSHEVSTKEQNDNLHFGKSFHRRKNYENNPTYPQQLSPSHSQPSPPRSWYQDKKKSNNQTLKQSLRIRLMKWIIARKSNPLLLAVYVVMFLQAIAALRVLLIILDPCPTLMSLLPTSIIQKQLTITPKNETALLVPGKQFHHQCVAWRSTSGCDPDGPQLSDGVISAFVQTDLGCDQIIPTMGSGYCELRSKSGELIKAFKKSCREGYPRLQQYQPFFKCKWAASFLAYRDRALSHEPSPPFQITSNNDAEDHEPTRGIVIGAYPKMLASVYAVIRTLREVHHCQLPIELWCTRGELTEDNPLVKKIMESGKIHLRFIDNTEIQTFMAKPYSIAYSEFDQVLFLDSDNFPIRDPAYLFETPEFKSTGALFWKDFWISHRDEFFVTKKSLIWELLGIPPNSPIVYEQEMESAQIVIDRKKSEEALKTLLFLAETFGEFIEPLGLLLGDKDLFRLSWHMTNTPFYYAKDPPGLAGPAPLPFLSKDKVCGVSMIQFDPSGEPVFFHRNFAKFAQESNFFNRMGGFFTGSAIFPAIVWKKGVKFTGDDPDSHYAIRQFFSLWQANTCYHPRADVRGYFEEIDYRGTDVEALDRKVSAWAFEGMKINR